MDNLGIFKKVNIIVKSPTNYACVGEKNDKTSKFSHFCLTVLIKYNIPRDIYEKSNIIFEKELTFIIYKKNLFLVYQAYICLNPMIFEQSLLHCKFNNINSK